jgi:lipopolysaccharide/colanic/teichoic acid biosynthesis glycosyltransferase
MSSKHKPYGPYEKYFKRPLDLLCGLAAVIVFWWLYLIIALLVRLKLGTPILFTQERPGKDEKIFKLYKFRTMTDATDEQGNLLPDEVHLTKFGKFLRFTSFDELPEAFNIIKGDMSVIGDGYIIGTTKKNHDFTRVSRVEVKFRKLIFLWKLCRFESPEKVKMASWILLD